ncbi:hypothetical protein GGS24DRAFT_497426 [Hypoxylon argillaceum]|nr:hypothetical protein GGS24DRAFT_497426 [Hypoxylon argillaceum]
MYGRIPTPESEETPNRDGTQELLSPEWMYGVSASGFVELHVKPTITFGIDFNKNFIKTDVNALSFRGWALAKSPFPITSIDPIQIVPNTCPIISKRDLDIGKLGKNSFVGGLDGDDDDGSCVLMIGRSDESTCQANILDARDVDILTAAWAPENSTYAKGRVGLDATASNSLWKRVLKSNTWNLDPDGTNAIATLNFNAYPEYNQGNTDRIAKWFGFDEQGMSTPNCPTAIKKFTHNQVDTSQYQTDHIFEAQAIIQLLEIIIDNAIGGDSSAGRNLMALVYKGVNNDKGHFFRFDNLGALDVTAKVRASKMIQRNTAGVFGYMQVPMIASKFQASGQAIEAALASFDNAYNWGSAPNDELGRPTGTDRGLRDLWAYWIDVYLATIEPQASAWSSAASAAMQGLSTSSNDEAARWVASFFGPGGAGSMLQFSQPNPGSQVGRTGVNVPRSRYET